MNFIKFSLSLLFLISLTGCSTIFGDDNQVISITTVDLEGNPINDAQCELTNDEGTFYVRTPGQMLIKQACGDAKLICTKEGYTPATQSEIEKSHKGSTWANVLFWPGYFIDRISGSACKYPDKAKFYFKKDQVESSS